MPLRCTVVVRTITYVRRELRYRRTTTCIAIGYWLDDPPSHDRSKISSSSCSQFSRMNQKRSARNVTSLEIGCRETREMREIPRNSKKYHGWGVGRTRPQKLLAVVAKFTSWLCDEKPTNDRDEGRGTTQKSNVPNHKLILRVVVQYCTRLYAILHVPPANNPMKCVPQAS